MTHGGCYVTPTTHMILSQDFPWSKMWDTEFSLILQIAEHSQEWNGDDDEWSVFRSSQPQWRQVPTQCWARSLHNRNGCRQTLRAKTEQENCPVKPAGFCRQNKSFLISRIFTVILYMFSVSLGAILLSLYYVFIWKNPHTQALDKKVTKERRALRYQSLTLGLIFRTTRLILVAESFCQISPVPLLKPWSSITSTSTMTTTRYCQSQHSRRRLVSLLVK